MDTEELRQLRKTLETSSDLLDDLVRRADMLEEASALLDCCGGTFSAMSSGLHTVQRPLQQAIQMVRQACKAANVDEAAAAWSTKSRRR